VAERLFQPGQLVEDYVVRQSLGRGGMAELYLALDLLLKRKVIIKALRGPFLQDGSSKEQFFREAEVQAGLDNPHLVQVFRVFQHRGCPCLVMQHVQGTDLEKVIKRARTLRARNGRKGALSPERAVHIFLQILEGVGWVHKYRIIHGDIKPSNILLDSQGRVKITDFGLSFMLRNRKKVKGEDLPGGTLQYMSPEQLLNEPVDLRSDIYSLGVTLFHMLTGEVPSKEIKRHVQFLEYHMESSLESAQTTLGKLDLHPALGEAVLKALQRNPGKRHQSCLEFSLALREDASFELYSELLRLTLLAKRPATAAEKTYLRKIAESKGLLPEEAEALERSIRHELGIRRKTRK
jgi:serine/threonine protein kinase